jgi:hypothetical protein
MKNVRSGVLAMCAATLAGLTACSSGTSGAPQPGPTSLPPLNLPTQVPAAPAATQSTSAAPMASLPDACALLPRAEAEAVAGVKLEPGDDTKARDPMSDTATCTYNAPVTGSSGSITVFVQMGPEYGLGVDKALHHKFRPVAGIADGALEETNNIFFHSVDVWVQLSSAYSAQSAHLEAAAKKMAARLSSTSS